MSEDQDDSQKTEEPSHKKLEEAVKKGQVAFSREVGSFAILLSLALILILFAPGIMHDARLLITPYIERPESFPMDAGNIGNMMVDLLQASLVIMLVPIFLTICAAFAGSLIQNKFNISSEPLSPKFSKISPLAGLKRMFSLRSVVEFLKGVLKLTIVGVVAYVAIEPELERLRQLPNDDTYAILAFIATLSTRMMIGICCVMFLIAVMDYLYQHYEYIKSLRMTKQEQKDEYKQQEGDPIIKQRLRSLRMERARKRMMAAVPTSDVVITNPTHYAVALKYDSASMQAPLLVAKGLDDVALKIREIAKEHDIPIVENPPLARTLHAAVDIDKEVPVEHYKAVAEVIGYVYKLKGKLPLHKK